MSYAEVLRRVAAYQERELSGSAEAQRDVDALRELARILERMRLSEDEAIVPATAWGTHARGIWALDQIATLAAGFTAAPQFVVGRRGGLEQEQEGQNNPNDRI